MEKREKTGTAWNQNLNKEQVKEESKKRGIEVIGEGKLDELRPVLREAVRNETTEDKTRRTAQDRKKMEYTSQLDFKIGTDVWEEFVERIELYFEANEIAENKKRAILLTKIDAETYKVVRKVCAPAKPKDVALSDIIKKVGDYIKPKVNKTVRRVKFRERKQGPEESVTQYVAALRSLAAECAFADETEAIIDQLLSGTRSKTIKIALLKTDNLILEDALKTATAIEEANKAVEEFEASAQNEGKPAEPEAEVYRVRAGDGYGSRGRANIRKAPREERSADKEARRSAGSTCTCCGKLNHQKRDCWHRAKHCDSCGLQGHLRAVCRARAQRTARAVRNIQREDDKTSDTDSEIENDWCDKIRYESGSRLKACNLLRIEPQFLGVEIEGGSVNMEIDGGSEVTLMNENDCKKMFPNKEIVPINVNLIYYGGRKEKTVGKVRNVTVKYGQVSTTGGNGKTMATRH